MLRFSNRYFGAVHYQAYSIYIQFIAHLFILFSDSAKLIFALLKQQSLCTAYSRVCSTLKGAKTRSADYFHL